MRLDGVFLVGDKEEMTMDDGELLRLYTAELDHGPVLTATEERALFVALARGDCAAKQALIVRNLRLVLAQATRYCNRGVDLLDLIQAGNMALIRAIELFNPDGTGRFSTYAMPCIRGAMVRAIQLSPVIRFSVHVSERLNEMHRLEERLAQDMGHNPTTEEIATAMGLDASIVAHMRGTRMLLSLQHAETDDDTSLEDWLGSENDSFEDDAIEQMDAERIAAHVAELPEQQRKTICARYGLGGQEPQGLREIAKRQGVSKQRIHSIEHAALDELWKYVDPISGDILYDCYDEGVAPEGEQSFPGRTVADDPKPPAKGECSKCGHRVAVIGKRDGYYCDRSGRPLDKAKVTDKCVPCVLGNPWVPKKT